jgi:hypothetical protein
MRIAVIGGLERYEAEISRRAQRFGHAVEFHREWVGGRHASELDSIVQRCDLLIIVTQVNSHGAMYMTKKAAARYARPAQLVRTCSPSSFEAILALRLLEAAGDRPIKRRFGRHKSTIEVPSLP